MAQAFALPPAQGDHQAFHDVSALEGGYIDLPFKVFVADAGADEVHTCPSLCFLLKHSVSKELILFDMGLHPDPSAYSPTVQKHIQTYFKLNTPQDVYASLRKGGVEPSQITFVLISHMHFDHIGDTTEFIEKTNVKFIVGPGSDKLVQDGYPANPTSEFHQNTLPRDPTRVKIIQNAEFNTNIGPFPRACDFLGDGSLYIIDSPGHLPGHVNLLVRTSGDGGWLYLASDAAHDVRMIKSGRDIAVFPGPNGKVLCAHHSPEAARANIDSIRAVSKLPRVQVILAHDYEWDSAHKGSSFLPNKIKSA